MDTSKENLEQILGEFAAMICVRHGIRFQNGEYKVLLEEEMLADMVIIAGNPVLIKIHWRLLAEGLKKRKMHALKQQLQYALEISSKKMLHTLSQNPVAPALKKNFEDRRWTKQDSISKLFPNLLPESRVTISTYISVTAVDTETGESWTEKGYAHKTSIGQLERKAVINLSNVVLKGEEDE